tara:strand:- start:213 stop:803 length:591 start_codon:yes stop_codon:yes gene_type:complete
MAGILKVDTIQRAGSDSDQITLSANTVTIGGTSLKVPSILKTNGNKLDLGSFVGPSFKAYKSAAQDSITALSYQKVTFETEVWDTDNCYDPSTSRFTPNVAGYYLINSHLEVEHASIDAHVMNVLYKNGAVYANGGGSHGDTSFFPSETTTWIVPMNGSGDYVEAYVYGSNNGSAFNLADDHIYRCTFEGILMRGL